MNTSHEIAGDVRPSAHVVGMDTVRVEYAPAHGYAWRARCDCGYLSRRYAAEHAAALMADAHLAAAVAHAERVAADARRAGGRS